MKILNFLFFTCICILIPFSFSFVYANNDYTNFDNELYCMSDIAMDLETEDILYSKNEDLKIYPASTTKILTALIVIENLDLEKKVIITKDEVDMIPYNSSVMGIKTGEIFSVEQLLYGLLLPSGNDAAIVLAKETAGNVENFVNLMNEKCSKLGLTNTHFCNPHGYHDENHYSTAKDMAKLFKTCMQNDVFVKIISSLSYKIEKTNLSDEKILVNSAKILNPSYSGIYNKYIKGGKTGYTIEANGTFIGYAQKENKKIIIGCFNGLQNINGYQGRFLDATKLTDYIFKNYDTTTLVEKNSLCLKIPDKYKKLAYTVTLNDDINVLKNINDTKYENFSYDINIDFNKIDNVANNIESTDFNNVECGFITFFLNKDNQTLSIKKKLYLTKIEIQKNNTVFLSIFYVSIILIILIYTIIKLKKIFRVKHNEKNYIKNIESKKHQKIKKSSSKMIKSIEKYVRF